MTEDIPKYEPDKVIPNKNSLTYPVQIGDQKITLPDNNIFKIRGLTDLEHYYRTKLLEVKGEYDKLVDDYNINKRVYESYFRFEPVVGHIYHLYINTFEEEFLSLIGPNEWDMKYIGSFKLTGDRRWEKL